LLLDGATGETHLLKTPSTPEDQSIGIHHGIEEIIRQSGIAPGDIEAVLHGSTVSTNIVLEEKGARVGLLVTADSEQILHLARSRTPGPLAGWITMEKPDPLADLEHTRGINERMSAKGDVITPLAETEARDAVRELLAAGVESITISLLHAYANPAHEQRLKAIIRETDPNLPVSLSSDLVPEFGEYERTLMTVMNAYVQPGMRRYLTGFEEKLRSIQFSPKVNIARSDGGLMSIERAAEYPVYTILSGPAGGVSGAAYLASLAGYPQALGFDMGGTSTDVSLIQNGRPTISRQTNLGPYPIKAPAVEVHSVGAGGGSIAHVPMTGALRVGPESAGAEPGPACYGHGGEAPTVTDANVVLGRLPPKLLGGDISLDVQAAEAAISKIAGTLGLDVYQAAEGILDIVNENMFGALRLISVQKGLDPRDFALVAFGGAGPLHGNAMGILTGCNPVIVPPTPGVLSALGFLYSDIKNEFTQTFARALDDVQPGQIADILTKLGNHAGAWLTDEGLAREDHNICYQAELRYFRQGYEFSLDIDLARMINGGLEDLASRFGAAHEKHYGFRLDQPVEIVNLRCVGFGEADKVQRPTFELGGPDAQGAAVEQSQVYFNGGFVATTIYDRAKLTAGNRLTGPAVITQKDTTTVIHPGHVGEVDVYLNILISREGDAPGRQAVVE
jgi:N-methylhydantoinase A